MLWITDQQRGGTFVEFGAMDGRRASNTWTLEKTYDWQGLLIEPMPKHRGALSMHRSCRIDTRCISDETGSTVKFSTGDGSGYPGMVGYNLYGSSGSIIEVETVRLNDLLVQHDMPRDIDYVSMDVDGAEVMILEDFDFDQHRVRIWSIEHNELRGRDDILWVMAQHGYQRVIYTEHCYDDFYVHKDYLRQRNLI